MKEHLFKPGQSGNPSGRPKSNQKLVDLARAHTEAALETLVGIMANKSEVASARVSAANAILDRGWGKPPQKIEGDEENPLHIISRLERVIVDPANTDSAGIHPAAQA
jgi:hypothetical protein